VQLGAVCSFPVEELLLTQMAFRPDGHHIAIGHRNPVLYEVLSGQPVRAFPFERFVAWAGFSGDGRYFGAVNVGDHRPQTNGLARVFEVDTGQVVFEARPRFPVQAACFRGSGEDLVFLYRDAIPEPAEGVPGQRERVRGVRLPSLETDCELELPGWRLRHVAAGEALTLVGHDVAATCYEVEGARLSHRRQKVGRCCYPWGNPLQVRNLGYGAGKAFLAPGGDFLVLERVDFQAGQRSLCLVDVEAGTARALLPLPSEVVPACAFCRDGGRLLTLNEEPEMPVCSLRLWDSSTGRQTAHTTVGLGYQAVALNWPTRRIAVLGGGRCDIGLIAA
jgi:hypothetical protein